MWIWRALILLQLVNGVLGWGKEGHFAICKIAEVRIFFSLVFVLFLKLVLLLIMLSSSS